MARFIVYVAARSRMPRFKQQVQTDRGAILNGDKFGGEFLIKNWPYKSDVVSNSGLSFVWDDTNRVWFSFGTDTTNTFVYTSANGLDWLFVTTIANFAVRVMSATKVPNTNFIMVGGNPAGSSSNKIYYSTDVGGTWNVPSGGVGSADAENIEATTYGPNVGYLAMGNTSGHIYRSTNGVSGWSLVFTAGGSPTVLFKGLFVGWNLSTPIALAFYLGSSTYYSSVNGTSWITRSFTGGTVTSAAYSASRKTFYCVNGTGQLYSSASGVGGWTLISNNAVLTVIRSFGNILVGMGSIAGGAFGTTGVVYSADNGLTWHTVMTTSNIVHNIAVAQQFSNLYPGGTTEPIYEPHQAMVAIGAPSTMYWASLKGV
jgi:hypothetical protein